MIEMLSRMVNGAWTCNFKNKRVLGSYTNGRSYTNVGVWGTMTKYCFRPKQFQPFQKSSI